MSRQRKRPRHAFPFGQRLIDGVRAVGIQRIQQVRYKHSQQDKAVNGFRWRMWWKAWINSNPKSFPQEQPHAR